MTPLKSAHGKPSLQMSSGDIASSTGYMVYVTVLTRKEKVGGFLSMPGPFDNAAKRLLREKPQHFVSWLVAGGIFRRILPNELKSRNIFADGLFSIIVNEQPALLHIEFQTRNHETVPKLLLKYN